MASAKQALEERLWAEGEEAVFAIIDGASVPDLLQVMDELDPKSECLYAGDLEPDMGEVAPYLVRLEKDAPFSNWVIEQGWGKHWGVLIRSAGNFRVLRDHFRRFVIKYSAEGQPMYFRFYDPRVMRSYLPECKAGEAKAMFGPVTTYVVEDEVPETALLFSFGDDTLKCERLDLQR